MGSVEFDQQLKRGKITEKQIAEYLKALGYHVLPTTDFAANGAPMLESADQSQSLVMPDLQAFVRGQGEWWESKLKSSAVATNRFAGRLVTGIDGIAWVRYCNVELKTDMPVAVVFVHEKEGEVRCGTLHQLSKIESHRSDRMGKGGMVFWKYESIPWWMSLEELKANAFAHQIGATLIEPSKRPPIERQLLRQSHVLRRHGLGGDLPREKIFFEPKVPPWTWTCLPCNATGIGSSSAHRCTDNVAWPAARAYWTNRLAWAFHGDREQATKVLEQPIARTDLATWLGPTWAADGGAR